MKYDCGSSITFRVPGSITATNIAVLVLVTTEVASFLDFGYFGLYASINSA